MARKKGLNIQNGRDVVNYAAEHGATVSQKNDGRVKISTEKGSMSVYDSTKPYSSVDKGNAKRWLKRLGLLGLGFFLFVRLILPAIT